MNKQGRRWRVPVVAFAVGLLIAPVVVTGAVASTDVQGVQDGAGVPGVQEPGDGVNASEWTISELRELGPHPAGSPTSLRPYGDAGGFWIQYAPTGLFVQDTPDTRVNAEPGTVIQRDYLYVNSFRGWDSEDLETTVHVVAWRPGTETRTGPNGSYQADVPVDVTHKRVPVTFAGGTYDTAKVQIPESYDEERYLTVWVDGRRSETQWVYRAKTSRASQEIPISTAGGLAVWGAWNIMVPFLAVAGLTIVGDRYLLEKIGRGPGVSPLEWAFFGIAALFLGGFVFYDGVLNTLVGRPYLLGVLGGLSVGLLAITVFSSDGEEALFLQFRPQEGPTGADGAGRLRVANQVHTVVERRRDGKKVVPRKGWLPALARAWPWSDATPVLEFDAHKQRRLESPPEDTDMPDSAGLFERIRTRFVGSVEDGDEYDAVYIVDPLADDVLQYQEETFTWHTPDVVSWPDPDEEPERVVRGVPLPRVAWGTIGGGLAAVGVVYAFVLGFVGSASWAFLAVCVALLACFVRPVEGRALAELAPAQFDAVINTRMGLLEGYSERSDAEHFQKKYHKSEARRRASARADSEKEDETIFREIADEMAPPEDVADGEVSVDD